MFLTWFHEFTILKSEFLRIISGAFVNPVAETPTYVYMFLHIIFGQSVVTLSLIITPFGNINYRYLTGAEREIGRQSAFLCLFKKTIEYQRAKRYQITKSQIIFYFSVICFMLCMHLHVTI